jgi:hypothetical protein
MQHSLPTFVPPPMDRGESARLIARLLDEERAIADELETVEERAVSLRSRLADIRENVDELRRSRIPHFNRDILEVLFEHLDLDCFLSSQSLQFSRYADARRNCAHLAILCLVSRSWLHPAQKLLYRVIPILESYESPRFFRFCATVRENPAIRPHVHRFHVLLSETPWCLAMETVKLLPRVLIFAQDKGCWGNPFVEVEAPLVRQLAHLRIHSSTT